MTGFLCEISLTIVWVYRDGRRSGQSGTFEKAGKAGYGRVIEDVAG
jgi:hypothetical protein